MATLVMKQGEDATLQLRLTDDAGAPIPLDTALEIYVQINPGAVPGQVPPTDQWSLNTRTNFGSLEVDGAETNLVKVYIESINSSQYQVGNYVATMAVTFDDATFVPDGDIRKEYPFRNVLRVQEGFAKNLGI